MKSRHILVPLNLMRSPANALAAVQQMAANSPVRLTLLHVVELNIYPPQPSVNEQLRAESEAALRKLAKLFFGAAQAASVVIRFGRPADEIVALAKEIKPDLIVMCDSKPRWRLFRRSTIEWILRYAPCPTLVLPHPDKAARQAPQSRCAPCKEAVFFHESAEPRALG